MKMSWTSLWITSSPMRGSSILQKKCLLERNQGVVTLLALIKPYRAVWGQPPILKRPSGEDEVHQF